MQPVSRLSPSLIDRSASIPPNCAGIVPVSWLFSSDKLAAGSPAGLSDTGIVPVN